MNILIADDSALLRSIMKEVLQSQENITVSGEASNGRKAVELSRTLKPDLIIMDVNMPVMDGIEATRIITEESAVPILVFTSEIDVDKAFEAVQNGAVEILRKPPIDQLNDPVYLDGFMKKMRLLADKGSERASPGEKNGVDTVPEADAFALVAIGASTGGPVAVKTILSALPATFPVPIAVVQHLEEGFDKGYADWLNETSELSVTLAEKEGHFRPGTAVVAPADYHIRCSGSGYALDRGEKVGNQRPSVDVLFSSAAEKYRNRVMAVLLTGMGRDGADGCVAVKKAGGTTLCQDEKSSAIFGMPKAAIEQQGASRVLSLNEIALFLKKLHVKDMEQ